MPKDNQNLAAKVALRTQYIERYGGSSVIDCCQGDGLIWGILREKFPHLRYIGFDLKPKSGRLKIDSARMLAVAPLQYDIIDIDTYGEPWRHYLAAAESLRAPATVFLTSGNGAGGLSNTSNLLKGILNIPANAPQVLAHKATKECTRILLHTPRKYGIITSNITAVSIGDSVVYYGMRLTPQRQGAHHVTDL